MLMGDWLPPLQFKERSSATNVEISLPLPPDAIEPTVRTSQVPHPAPEQSRRLFIYKVYRDTGHLCM